LPIPIPQPSILDGYKRVGGRKRWRNEDGTRLFEWDGRHGEVEVYNARGWHLGAMHPVTGEMSEQLSFLEGVLEGRAKIAEIDDFVERWHESESAADLSDYLGMRPDEYSLWLENPEMLAVICSARRRQQPLAEVVNEATATLRLASRSSDRSKLISLQSWLRRQGVEA